MRNCKLQFHVSWLHSYFRKNPDAVYTEADPGFLEVGFKFTKGVRFPILT